MESAIHLDSICTHSEDVVAREIEGELIIVPLVSGIGDAEDELYTLNPTGQSIWQKMDGKRTLRDIALLLSEEYDAPMDDLQKDVLGLVNELAKRGMLSVVDAS
ncbi:PqqD family protein [bacterium]|nr:PqqD family protein [bacterium]